MGFQNWQLQKIFQGRTKYIEITTINMYLLIEIRQCHGNYIEVENTFMLEIDSLRNYSPNILGVLRGDL